MSEIAERLRFTACADYGPDWRTDATPRLLRDAAERIEDLEDALENLVRRHEATVANHQSELKRSVLRRAQRGKPAQVPSAEGVMPPKESRDAAGDALKIDTQRHPVGLSMGSRSASECDEWRAIADALAFALRQRIDYPVTGEMNVWAEHMALGMYGHKKVKP